MGGRRLTCRLHFAGGIWLDWAILGTMTAVFLVAACVVCARK